MQITFEQARKAVPLLLKHQAATLDSEQRWQMLSAAHVAGQNFFTTHWQTHVAMLAFAWQQRDAVEIRGQMMRLALIPFGHLFRRLPQGNPGRGNVSAFKPMKVPQELHHLIHNALQAA